MTSPKNHVAQERMKRRQMIAAWLRETMRKQHIKPTAWSRDSGLSPSTITRALSDGYDNILSSTTLAALAKHVGVPAPFSSATYSVPSPDVLAGILDVIMHRLQPNYSFPAERIMPYAQALRSVLLELSDDPAMAQEPTLADRLMRLALRQALDNNRQAE